MEEEVRLGRSWGLRGRVCVWRGGAFKKRKAGEALILRYYWDVKSRKCDTQQGPAGSPAAFSSAGAHFYSSAPPLSPPTAHLSKA